jgi:hypothetical protein
MKKTLSIIIIAFTIMTLLYGCTEQQRARSFGGTETIELNPGQRLVNITWKETELWILTKKDTTKPTTYSFKQKTLYGNIEGEVIVIEK